MINMCASEERVPFVPLVSLQKWIVRRSMPHATWAALLACCTLLLVVSLALCWPVRSTLARNLKVCGRWSTQRSQEILILAESAESLPWIFACLETWLSFFIECGQGQHTSMPLATLHGRISLEFGSLAFWDCDLPSGND